MSYIASKLPQNVQDLVMKGSYNSYYAKDGSGFVITTKIGKTFTFDADGQYVGETSKTPNLQDYDQVYIGSSQDIMKAIQGI